MGLRLSRTPSLSPFNPSVPLGSRQHEKVDSDICPPLKRQSIHARSAKGMNGRDATLLPFLPPSPLPVEQSPIIFSRGESDMPSHLADRSASASLRRPSLVDPSNDPFLSPPPRAAFRSFSPVTCSLPLHVVLRVTQGQIQVPSSFTRFAIS